MNFTKSNVFMVLVGLWFAGRIALKTGITTNDEEGQRLDAPLSDVLDLYNKFESIFGKNEMKTSKIGIEAIKRHEGLRLESYVDVAGYATVGYGHKLPVFQAGRKISITMEEAEGYLQNDLLIAETAVNTMGVSLSQNQFDALVSFVFNVGAGNFSRSTLRKKLVSGDIEGAAKEFNRWVYAGGKVYAGLVNRREDERARFEA